MTPEQEELYASLQRRRRPEDIAELVFEALSGTLTRVERKILDKARRGSLKNSFWGYTSMAQDFSKPVGMERQASRAAMLFTSARRLTVAQCGDPTIVEGYVREISAEIGKAIGSNSFKYDRLNRTQRMEADIEHSKRQYNKRFRLLIRMERKVLTLARESRKAELFQVAKRGLIHRVTREDFFASDATACFLAYYAARAGLRSEFTIDGQQRAFDEVAQMLFDRCDREYEATSWFAIAHAFPTREVLRRLTPTQKGELLGIWFGYLQELAALLEETWERSKFDRATMIVGRGDDSTTWNTFAGAWNRAREHWFAWLGALEMEALLDSLCPGKVMRLMAADVAAWHRSAKGTLHPDTEVWSKLPPPWEVLTGRASCDRKLVEKICQSVGVDPEKNGWIGPKPPPKAVAFRSTPELVHGVSVGSPYLAEWLRSAGVFSGKTRP